MDDFILIGDRQSNSAKSKKIDNMNIANLLGIKLKREIFKFITL